MSNEYVTSAEGESKREKVEHTEEKKSRSESLSLALILRVVHTASLLSDQTRCARCMHSE